jgi:hypothetical protein
MDEERIHISKWLSMFLQLAHSMSRVRRIRLKNLFASKRITANLDLIRLIFACFIFFTYLIDLLHLLIFALKYLLQFALKNALM